MGRIEDLEEKIKALESKLLKNEKIHNVQMERVERSVEAAGNANTRRHKDGSWHVTEVRGQNLLEDEAIKGMLINARDITERKRAEEEKETLITELKKNLAKIKTLSGLLPICAWCKKIRDDAGYWQQLESYLGKHSSAEFSHSICPECLEKNFAGPDLKKR